MKNYNETERNIQKVIEKVEGKCYNETIEGLYCKLRTVKADIALLSEAENRQTE